MNNPFQRDIDGDTSGDECDSDLDGDGRLNNIDNCPYFYNPTQADKDGDKRGDECDNCFDAPNFNQVCNLAALFFHFFFHSLGTTWIFLLLVRKIKTKNENNSLLGVGTGSIA